MALREFLRITEEAQYGVFNPSPTAGVNQIYIREDDSNAFTMRPQPVQVRIMYGGGYAVPAYTVSDKQMLSGAINVKLCYSQAALLLGWGLGVVNSGQTYPWTTDQPVGDLASCSIEHAYFYDDTGTWKRRRYLGCKVSSGSMQISSESQICTLTLQITGGVPQSNTYDMSTDPSSGAFPVPGSSSFPFDYLLFTHSSGNFTLGSSLTKYESLNLNWTNKLDARFFASNFVQEIRSLGRDLTLESMLKLDSSPDFRVEFERIMPLACSVEFNNLVNTVTMNYNSNVILSKLDDDLQLDKIFFRTAGISSQFDANAGTDFTLTVT